jgi:hypothetical protein
MTVSISRLYDDSRTASRVVMDLEAAGLSHKDISMISSNADDWYGVDGKNIRRGKVDRDADGVDDRAEGAGAGAGIGAAVGGSAGLLAGLGLMAIPGLGPVVAAGWLAAMAVGAIAGGAAGSLIGALTQAGVPKEDAEIYAEGVRRGGTLVSARVPDTDRARYEAILDQEAVNIRTRAEAYRETGWQGFDPNAKPYDATGDYGVAAGLRYDDQTTRGVYEEPIAGESKTSRS